MQAAAYPKTNLPALTLRFIGRRKEILALNNLLSDSEIRMVNIFAPGGMGKTQVALTVAYQQLERFADGVYLITILTPLDAEQLAITIADNIAFQFQPGGTRQQQLLAYLQQRNLLLILDNAEYLIEALPYLTSILQLAPDVKILATSRTRSDLMAETLFLLGGLTWQQEQEDESANSDAVALFLQRAKSVRPDLQLLPHYRESVLEICQLTQGMPLAIILAASWLNLLTPKEIAQEIRRDVGLLETDLRDVPERQRSIRAIFDYTWALLSPTERRVLMNLSVFQRGFTREAAQTVAQGDLRHLMNLLKSAVLQPAFTEGRYELHELLRHYAHEHLQSSGELEAVLAAHSRYFLNFISRQESDIKGRNQLPALNYLQADIENLHTAWEWAAHHAEITLMSDALEGLFWLCMMRSRYQLFESIYEQTTQRFPLHSEPRVQVLMARFRLRYLWMQRWREGSIVKYPEALGEIETHLTLFHQFNLLSEIGLCHLLLGDALHTLTDDLGRAQLSMQSAYEMFMSLNDYYYAAWALHFLAKFISDTQRIEQGFDPLEQSLALRRRIGDQIGGAYSLYNQSVDLLLLGQLKECEQVTHEILEISGSTGEQSSLLMAQITLCLLALFSGRFNEAKVQAQINQALARSINHGLGIVWMDTIQTVLEYFDGSTQGFNRQVSADETITTQALMRYFIHWSYAFAENEIASKRHLLSAMRYAHAVRAYSALVWCIPPWALWELRYGDPVRAASLLALAQQQPATLMGWLPDWLNRYAVQRRLEEQLGSEAFDAAYERGRTWDPEQVVSSFLTSYTTLSLDTTTAPKHVQRANQQLIEPLSDRELEVLSYIARGLSNREIADELVVELSTIKKHLTHVYGKLEVNTRAQAILRAQQLQLV